MTHIGQSILIDTFLKQKKYDLELYASGIYPRIFTWIDSLFKAGEGPLGFLTKTKKTTRTRICRALRDVKATPWRAARGGSTRI